jgi:hypothetical protein
MFGSVRVRGGACVVAGLGAAALLVCGLMGAGSASAGAKVPAAGASSAGSGTVPWSSVGAGWNLVEYSAWTSAKPSPTTLFLVSPAGKRYAVYAWKASKTEPPELIDWSGDKTRALLISPAGENRAIQLNLVTGKLSPFNLPAAAAAEDYTLPSGAQILGADVGTDESLARYSLAGRAVAVISRSDGLPYAWLPAPDGKTYALHAATGLTLVTSTGKTVRNLTMPGSAGCYPARWWTNGEVVAWCYLKSSPAESLSRLWVVPVSGARPVALTTSHPAATGLTDEDAWKLSTGTYAQVFVPCPSEVIGRIAPNGTTSILPIPGASGGNAAIVTVSGTRLLVSTAGGGCSPAGNQLVWYDTRTHAEQWLFRSGAVSVVPYYSIRNGRPWRLM